MDPYRVELDAYSGPLDLLLYLIRKAEIDVFDVTVSRIIQQYLTYMHDHTDLDVGSLGEFLLLATTLLEIKSKLILPREELNLEEALQDPRFSMVHELLEYRKIKKLSSVLEDREEEEMRKFSPRPQELPLDEKDLPEVLAKVLKDIDILDLFNTYDRMARDIVVPPPIVYKEIPMEEILEFVEHFVGEQKRTSLFSLLKNSEEKGWMAGVFIAVLELVRQKKIRATQENPFDEIWLEIHSPEEKTGTV